MTRYIVNRRPTTKYCIIDSRCMYLFNIILYTLQLLDPNAILENINNARGTMAK